MKKIINPCDYKIDGCFLDKNNKFCLIHIYKNASISIRNVLGMRGNYYKYDNVKDMDDLVTICIIRNPINRIVSIYMYMLRNEDYGFGDQHPLDLISEADFYVNKANIIESFDQFLEQLKGKNFFSAVTMPQTQFLKDRNLNIDDIDEVLIQEEIQNDFHKFVHNYSLDVCDELPHDNKGSPGPKHIIMEYINTHKSVFSKINNLYKSDFELYDKIRSLRLITIN